MFQEGKGNEEGKEAPAENVYGQRPVSRVSMMQQRLPSAAIDIASVDFGVVLHGDEYPYTKDHLDMEKESLLESDDPDPAARVPQLIGSTFQDLQISLNGQKARELIALDKTCAGKHFGAIKVVSLGLDRMLQQTLVAGEVSRCEMELVGIQGAPGLRTEKSQHCRLVWTSKSRLIFLQAGHSAELAVSTGDLVDRICPCPCRRLSSLRKYGAYVGIVDASSVLEVFVDQLDFTAYTKEYQMCCPKCVCDCTFGGVVRSFKNADELTKVLDYDDLEEGTDKFTRVMKHSLVIRYYNVATNTIEETVAVADPAKPVDALYKLAAEINDAKNLNAEHFVAGKGRPGNNLSGTVFREYAAELNAAYFATERSFQIFYLALFIVIFLLFIVYGSFLVVSFFGSLIGLPAVLVPYHGASGGGGFGITGVGGGIFPKWWRNVSLVIAALAIIFGFSVSTYVPR